MQLSGARLGGCTLLCNIPPASQQLTTATLNTHNLHVQLHVFCLHSNSPSLYPQAPESMFSQGTESQLPPLPLGQGAGTTRENCRAAGPPWHMPRFPDYDGLAAILLGSAHTHNTSG